MWLARYLNAARLAPGWVSPRVLVEIRTTRGPVLHPQENNAVWFSSGYRAGRAKLNLLITHGLSAEVLRDWRDRMGPPARTITCPEDHDWAIDGKAAFQVWVWDRDDAQAEQSA